LVAEDVAKVDPDLVGAMKKASLTPCATSGQRDVLNEFLEEHRKSRHNRARLARQDLRGKTQQATIDQLKSAMAEQQRKMAQYKSILKEQAAQIQKVSATRK